MLGGLASICRRESGEEVHEEKIRLFNTELRMMPPRDCYQAVVADGTYTILLIREPELNINNDLLLSAMKLRIDALSYRGGVLEIGATEDISQRYRMRKNNRGTLRTQNGLSLQPYSNTFVTHNVQGNGTTVNRSAVRPWNE